MVWNYTTLTAVYLSIFAALRFCFALFFQTSSDVSPTWLLSLVSVFTLLTDSWRLQDGRYTLLILSFLVFLWSLWVSKPLQICLRYTYCRDYSPSFRRLTENHVFRYWHVLLTNALFVSICACVSHGDDHRLYTYDSVRFVGRIMTFLLVVREDSSWFRLGSRLDGNCGWLGRWDLFSQADSKQTSCWKVTLCSFIFRTLMAPLARSSNCSPNRNSSQLLQGYLLLALKSLQFSQKPSQSTSSQTLTHLSKATVSLTTAARY